LTLNPGQSSWCSSTTTTTANDDDDEADGSWTANLTVVGCDHNDKLPGSDHRGRVPTIQSRRRFASFLWNQFFMADSSYAVILGTVLKYEMTYWTRPSVMAIPDAQQTLEDASVTSDGVTTTLTLPLQ
jgi:hypothetical protein